METINFRMREKEAEWCERRRQVKNDLEYEKKQAQRKCAADIEQAQRKCAADIEQAQRKCAADIEQARRKAHELLKAISIEEDTYKAKATEVKEAHRARMLAELERIDELAAKHHLNGEDIPMREGGCQ